MIFKSKLNLRLTVDKVRKWTSTNGYTYEGGWCYTIERKFADERVWCGVQHKSGFGSEGDAELAGKLAMKHYREDARQGFL